MTCTTETEGPRENPTSNFDDWETRQGNDPADPRNGRLYEYPVKRLVQPSPLAAEFRFDKPPHGAKKCQPPPVTSDRKKYQRRWMVPPNDPGPIRTVVDKDGRLVGAMYHPKGNAAGYERAPLEPLDRDGRGELARHNDLEARGGRATWPKRGPAEGWPEQ
ncbi:hypothetical protein N658DRAFT_561294 [Parathielavia hyrcaniae]|uniref:Uncharacterized protein n=1 Tax=Parathielavia hyrcaniae TaxID=113614 RepID=A0AAN6PUG5_9PEZI|nr:hypothetical protein N658DRAFT_561294 [Parathielavia hyrcaniae]